MKMQRELSSRFTFFYKYIVIGIWFCGFALGTQEVLLAGPDHPKWLQYFATWLLFTGFIYFATGSIKKVTLTGKELVVSNFIRSEVIAVSEVDSVDGSTFLSPKLVWFNLKNPSPFGSRKISFIPAHRMTAGIGKHPLVIELTKEFDL